MTDRPVPCGTCSLCCQSGGPSLDPVVDDLEEYLHIEAGRGLFVVPPRDNGDCAYLIRGVGCLIYDRRPAVCRGFDCRELAVLGARGDLADRGREILGLEPGE